MGVYCKECSRTLSRFWEDLWENVPVFSMSSEFGHIFVPAVEHAHLSFAMSRPINSSDCVGSAPGDYNAVSHLQMALKVFIYVIYVCDLIWMLTGDMRLEMQQLAYNVGGPIGVQTTPVYPLATAYL